MSAHSYEKWSLTDGVETAPIKTIAECIKYHGYRTPGIYGCFTGGDQMIFNIGHLLSETRGQTLSKEFLEQYIDKYVGEPEPGEEPIDPNILRTIKDVTVLVVTELELLDKSIPIPPPPKPVEQFKTFTLPNVRKPFPKL